MLVLDGPSAGVTTLAFTDDGQLLAVGGRDGSVQIWNGYELQHSILEETTNFGVTQALAFRPGTHRLYAGGRNKGLSFWDVETNTWSYRDYAILLPSRIDDLVFISPFLLAVSAVQLHLFDVAEDRWRQSPAPRSGPLAAHPPTGTLARSHGVATDQLTLWNIAKPDHHAIPSRYAIRSLAFRPDGTQVAGAVEYTVIIYDVLARREMQTIKAHVGRVTSLAYSPDGRTLATASWDQTVKLWDANTLSLRTTLDWKIGRLSCVRYSPDGSRLVASSADSGSIVMWDAE